VNFESNIDAIVQKIFGGVFDIYDIYAYLALFLLGLLCL